MLMTKWRIPSNKDYSLTSWVSKLIERERSNLSEETQFSQFQRFESSFFSFLAVNYFYFKTQVKWDIFREKKIFSDSPKLSFPALLSINWVILLHMWLIYYPKWLHLPDCHIVTCLMFNYGLWAIMMYQYRFIIFNKCTALVGDVNGGGYACVGARGYGEFLYLPLNFSVDLKLF